MIIYKKLTLSYKIHTVTVYLSTLFLPPFLNQASSNWGFHCIDSRDNLYQPRDIFLSSNQI